MSEHFSNLIVEGILGANPFWMLGLNLIPQPISKVRVELTVWMETITSFNHIFWITSFHHFSLQNFHGWEIVVNQIKVLESVPFADDLLVDFGKVLGSFSGKSSDSFVGVEPSPARTDFEAVQEVINISVSDIQGMSPVM